MTGCAEMNSTIDLLLDDELAGEELNWARAHLLVCIFCMRKFEEGERLSRMIRAARSVQAAPESLRNRILSLTSAPSLSGHPINGMYPSSTVVMPGRHNPSSAIPTWKRLIPIAAIFLIALGAIFSLHMRSQSRANSFINTAILADRTLSTHMMPLDVESNSPTEIAAWFSERVPFRFRLPNSGIAADETAKYTMVGGRLISFRGEHAALVAFRLSGENISLLVASDRVAHAEGGSVTASNGLKFHNREIEGHRVITWDNQGLTYALIFSSAHFGQQHSCSSCH